MGFLLIGLFVVMWVLQAYLSIRQAKHYRVQMNELRQQSSGYLGVGVHKKRFSVGSVVMITTNLEGIITQAKGMTGVTVFARFKLIPDLIGMHVNECDKNYSDKPEDSAITMAIQKLKAEKETKEKAYIKSDVTNRDDNKLEFQVT
ncbi:transcriptional regulator GutM [Brevibacillus daliensis]|uniref:transcriptional regulator GutM n=1 Tax=Brevibacillus daliensis TaxID=2892995 RepID=UPI001E59AC29|nr:transcriptional regulator GutM [Brevibacillus daliensis]